MQDKTQSESLEIALAGKRFAICLDPLLDDVRDELRAMFAQDVEPLMLLKAFITKAQEHATLCQNLENLCQNLCQNLDEISSYQIDIQSLETP